MLPELLVAVVVIAADGGFLQRPVHPLDLAVGPRVIGLGEAVLDAVFETDAVELVDPVAGGGAGAMLRHVAELHAVVGQNRVDLVGHGLDHGLQEVSGDLDGSGRV